MKHVWIVEFKKNNKWQSPWGVSSFYLDNSNDAYIAFRTKALAQKIIKDKKEEDHKEHQYRIIKMVRG